MLSDEKIVGGAIACVDKPFVSAAWERIKKIYLEAQNTPTNKPMPKLPTLAECQAHVQRQMWTTDFSANSINITKSVYDYICRQLSA